MYSPFATIWDPWVSPGLENVISDGCPKPIDSLDTPFMKSGVSGSGGCQGALGDPPGSPIADFFSDVHLLPACACPTQWLMGGVE